MKLLAPLMHELIREINRVHWNTTQSQWMPSQATSCLEWAPLEPVTVGDVEVTTEWIDGDGWAKVAFAGMSIETELGGKRLFHYSTTDMNDEALIAWWRAALSNLREADIRAYSTRILK